MEHIFLTPFPLRLRYDQKRGCGKILTTRRSECLPGYSMSRICIAVVKDRDLKKKKKSGKEKVYFIRKSGQELKAGT